MITACLIVWKRQHNIPKIVESLVAWPFISEILVRDNSKLENTICYGRYQLAEKATNNFIYTQDDDCIVKNLDVVYGQYMKNTDRICHSGIEDYEKVLKNNTYGEHQMAMFGWGAFFKKDKISVLQKYIDKYGKDYIFMRETDRIFSILSGGHHAFVRGDIQDLGRFDTCAMSQQTEHNYTKNLAIERALSCYQS